MGNRVVNRAHMTNTYAFNPELGKVVADLQAAFGSDLIIPR